MAKTRAAIANSQIATAGDRSLAKGLARRRAARLNRSMNWRPEEVAYP
jgi:hypothetical protein